MTTLNPDQKLKALEIAVNLTNISTSLMHTASKEILNAVKEQINNNLTPTICNVVDNDSLFKTTLFFYDKITDQLEPRFE